MASKINKGEILAKFFDDGEYTALFADGAVSADLQHSRRQRCRSAGLRRLSEWRGCHRKGC